MRSNNRSQDCPPRSTSVSSFASAYFDAWQNYIDTLNDVWGDVTAPNAQLGAWASGFSKLAQAWMSSATEICGAFTNQHRGCPDDMVVAFVVDDGAEDTDPKSVPLPPGVQCPKIDWTPLRAVGDATLPEIAKTFLSVTQDSRGRSISIALVNLKPPSAKPPSTQGEPAAKDVALRDDTAKAPKGVAPKNGMYFAMVYEIGTRRPLAVVAVTFV
jgi:hypothetical protein